MAISHTCGVKGLCFSYRPDLNRGMILHFVYSSPPLTSHNSLTHYHYASTPAMRLINIKTYQLETFDNWDTTPPYAILSHTWEQEEVLFHDITTDADGMKKKRGWGKILGASVEAEKLGIPYLWVDTCCIDKTSSAELSQSINSMFAWYRDARICFAYLGDFNGDDVEAFDMSRWWTRGWTLQELIAPVEVMFFAQDWTFVTLRSSSTERIAAFTGIGEVILSGDHLDELHNFSVAEKFSWAAKRMTTCGEDRAYSLMGIFGVNMAMIYGEGEQAACYRLQKEIFGVYPDHSIFAWDLKRSLLEYLYVDTRSLPPPNIESINSHSCLGVDQQRRHMIYLLPQYQHLIYRAISSVSLTIGY